MSMVQIDSETLKTLVTIIENDEQIKGLNDDVKGILLKAKNDALAEVKSKFADALEVVSDAVIHTVLPGALGDVVEAVADPLIHTVAPEIEEKAEEIIDGVMNKIENALS